MPHPREDILQAGNRRLQEELGITVDLHDCGWFHYTAHFPNGLSENEIDHVLVGKLPEDVVVKPNPAEVQAIRWVTIEALQQELATAPEQFTPWLKQALAIAKQNQPSP